MEVDVPIDVGRLTRPEADAFRYIAEALGAQFAGDLADSTDTESHVAPSPDRETIAPLPHASRAKGSALDVAPADPKAAALLERVPIACLVILNEGVAFINRSSVMLFGYTSANILEAAGGVGALFANGGPDKPGTMAMRKANGQTFSARVTMTTVEWGGETAMLVTAMPAGAMTPEPKDTPTLRLSRDPVITVLDANPDPIAIVSRGGAVEMCNRAFERLGPAGGPLRLDDRLSADDLEHIFDIMNLSFMLADGQARTTRAVDCAGSAYAVTIGALYDGQLACLVFHPLSGDHATPSHEPASTGRVPEPVNENETAVESTPEPEETPVCGTPLYRAVSDVRRLVKDAAVLIISERDEASAAERWSDSEVAEAHLIRLILLTLGARSQPGAVLEVRREGSAVTLDVPGAPVRAIEGLVGSDRIVTLADNAGRRISLGPTGTVTLRAARPADSLSQAENVAVFERTR